MKSIILLFAAFVTVKCQIYTLPYPPPCRCGLQPVPANPPCGNPVPIYAGPYEIPAAIPKGPICAPPVDLPRPIGAAIPNMQIMVSPYELALPSMPVPLPVPLPTPTTIVRPPCGCFDAPVPSYAPAELPMPLANPFLPAASPVSNPFMPIASPVSAMAPFSPLLPPACPCSRGQYLKKIPIPPPCI